MQNRVILEKDAHGLDESLNERDSSGYGLKVNARYYLQIHLRSESQSQQREQQIVMGSPLQQFFSFNYSLGDPVRNLTETTDLAATNDVDLPPTIDYKLLAQSQDKLWIRIENLADKFDLINGFER